MEGDVLCYIAPIQPTSISGFNGVLVSPIPLASVAFAPLSSSTLEPVGIGSIDFASSASSHSRLIPIDFGDVCLNYDKAYFAQKKLPAPRSLANLTKPEYKNLLGVENPAASSPGPAFMLATIGALGEDNWLNYWKQLKANGVKVVGHSRSTGQPRAGRDCEESRSMD